MTRMTRLGSGGPVMIVAGASAYRRLAGTWECSLTGAKIGYRVHRSGGECGTLDALLAADALGKHRS